MSGGPRTLLLLVKHSLPAVDPARPAREWPLSDEGRNRCHALARRLAVHAPARIVSSDEPKAVETAAIVAGVLGLAPAVVPGLHEHDRTGVPFGTREEFEAGVRRMFSRPSEVVLGRESADAARERFSAAIHGLLAAAPGESVAVVAHGTVVSLFVAASAMIEPFALWRRLGLPSFVAMFMPGAELVEVVGEAGEAHLPPGRGA